LSHLQKFPNEISNKNFTSAHFLTCNLEGLKIKMPKTLTLAKGILNENGVLKSTSTPTKGMLNENGVLKSTSTPTKGMLNENGVLKSTSTPTKGMLNENGVLKSTRKLNGDQATHLWGCIEKPMAWSW
jgi:hypothetical protein